MNLSVIILTKNEEDHIKDCIKWVKFADEIIIIDDYSIDNTVKIAESLGVKIYKRNLDSFDSQRNYALTKALGKWVLFIDADERVSSELAQEILSVVH